MGQESQVSSDGDRGEGCERNGLGERDDASEGWGGGSEGDSKDPETEEDGMTVGEPEGSGETVMALSWGTQESGAGGLQGEARAGRSNTRKAPSVDANEEGALGRHGARPAQ